MISFNSQLFFYAVQSLFRFFSKNLFIVIIYTLLVMLLSTLFLIQTSIKTVVISETENSPDIVVQNQKALQATTMDDHKLDKILEFYGVSDVLGRVYGHYDYKQADTVFTIIGIDPFETQKKLYISELLKQNDLSSNSMFVSTQLNSIFQRHYYTEYFNFVKPSLDLKQMKFSRTFESQELDKQKLCLMCKEDAREIFAYKADEITDVAIYLSNPNELMSVITKLQQLYPNAKIITKEDEKTKVEHLFDYDSGVFITLFTIAVFTFFMIIFDKTNGVSSSEKKEIGILKALGWRVEDILRVKLYEASIVSLFSYILGVLLALAYLYLFDGYYIRDIFLNIINVSAIESLDITLDIKALAIVFFLSVPVYIAATLIPSWRVATRDADEVMR
ncbi:FtsX-like permease family protein [Sulfurimonas sp. C5]|uniref:ABC transporter permease n=1 Tax=Sulfurimonas sp. C5 TaxID=3036947 RepID=UPI002453EE63|nr:FtsX-like permease family protein [Sulfurimonas sp. C5]MDH4944214.1 FtsX-like permease family protein [Sulfurimonas sp. C5]